MSNQNTESAPNRSIMRVVVTIIVVMSLGLTGINIDRPAYAGGGPLPPHPDLYAISPQIVGVGGPTFNLYFLGIKYFYSGGYNDSIFVSWNGHSLPFAMVVEPTAYGVSLYAAQVPANLISTGGVNTVTLSNVGGVSAPLYVTVTNGLLPDLPVVSIHAIPGRLGDGITNTITVSATDKLGNSDALNTYVLLQSSAGVISLNNGPTTWTHINSVNSFSYASRATTTFTPTVAITSLVLSPMGVVTNVISLTGVFTRYGSYLPNVSHP